VTAVLAAFHPGFCPTRDASAGHVPATSQAFNQAAAAPLRYTLTEASKEDRPAVEDFIRDCFDRSYAAQVTHFMPRLFSLGSDDGKMLGAFGLRPASEKLFLECYLDQAIEAAVGSVLGQAVERQQIIEVGQFAGTDPGTARTMIMLLTEYLHRHGFRWVVFTGTASLRNAFFRLGLNPVELAAAEPARLDQTEQGHWGNYYQHMPRVLFGNISEGYSRLTRQPRAEREVQA
jgi:hypothetical protein